MHQWLAIHFTHKFIYQYLSVIILSWCHQKIPCSHTDCVSWRNQHILPGWQQHFTNATRCRIAQWRNHLSHQHQLTVKMRFKMFHSWLYQETKRCVCLCMCVSIYIYIFIVLYCGIYDVYIYIQCVSISIKIYHYLSISINIIVDNRTTEETCGWKVAT